jgi:SnoaL-like domain
MRRLLTASFMFALLSATFVQASGLSDADVIRQARDRAEIKVLIWRYVQALDNLNEKAYPTFFTKDGSICCEHNHVYTGRAQLRKLIEEVKQSRAAARAKGQIVPKIYHPIFNFHIEFRGKNHAHIDSYWFTVLAEKPPNGSPNINLVGRCETEVVRVSGRWLIQSRNVFPR